MDSPKDNNDQKQSESVRSEKAELIWQMGLASLTETGNELRLPTAVSDTLTREELVFLESQLSAQLGAPTVSFNDLSMNVYRILRIPEMQKGVSSPSTSMSPAMSSSSISGTSVKGQTFDPKTRKYGQKSKIPRPPNAFILYRQKQHPLIKAKNPELHNNDISVILGKQWKNESSDIRNKFKALAEDLKRQHHIKFPGYQYAPRKPAEKKRRMTARKLAKLQEGNIDRDVSDFPTYDTNPNINKKSPDIRGAGVQADYEPLPTLENMIGLDNQSAVISNSSNVTGDFLTDLNNVFVSQATSPAQATPGYVPATPPNHTAFLTSLVDWDDCDEIQKALAMFTNDESREVTQIQENHHTFSAVTSDEMAAFEAELQRTNDWFE